MGISDALSDILRQVKAIPGLPNEMYDKFKWRLVDIQQSLKNLDAQGIVTSVIEAVNSTIGERFRDLESGFSSQFNKIQKTFETSLDAVTDTVAGLPETIAGQFNDIKEWTRSMLGNILNPVKDFMGSMWSTILPWLVGILAIVLFPVYGPLIKTIIGFIF